MPEQVIVSSPADSSAHSTEAAMGVMDVFCERTTEEARLAMTCACGSCHPTATAYRDDPRYE
jgi:hypothetical protein